MTQLGSYDEAMALALSLAAIVGIVVQVPAGHLGDTRGPRRVLTICMVGAALTSALPVLARTPWQLALLLALLAFFERSAGSVQQGVIAQLATGGRGVLFKAYLRAVTNTAIGLGSVFMHLHAEINWHRLFMDLIEGFDLGALERRQTEALQAQGLTMPS